MSLPDKVRQVIELQKAVYPLVARQRALEPWERPWEIGATVSTLPADRGRR